MTRDRWPEDDFAVCAWCGQETCDCPEQQEQQAAHISMRTEYQP
jgi:hypothetical protein